MKFTSSIVGFTLAFNCIMAAPVPEPVVQVVVTKDVMQTAQYTSTVCVPPSGAAAIGDNHMYKDFKPSPNPCNASLDASSFSSAIRSTLPSYSTSLPTPTTSSSEYIVTQTETQIESSTSEEHPSVSHTSTEVPTTTITNASTTTAKPTTTSAPPTLTRSNISVAPLLTNVFNSPKKTAGDILSNVGEATFYAPGLGSCGTVSTDSDVIAAISYILIDAVNSGNTNNNPFCGKQVKASYNGGPPVVITTVDRCSGCGPNDLDLSPEAFKQIGAHPDDGRVKFSWGWL